MAIFKVGFSRNAWKSVSDAYHHASHGDTIAFEPNYHINDSEMSNFTVEKSLTFKGMIELDDQGYRTFMNTVNIPVKVTGGADVTFENLWFNRTVNEVMISSNRSTLHLDDCIVSDDDEIAGDRVAIFIDNHSKFHFKSLKTYPQESQKNKEIKIFDSAGEILDSDLFSFVTAEKSQVKLERTNIFRDGSTNALLVKKSDIQMKDCVIENDYHEDCYPALWLEKSQLFLDHVELYQKNPQDVEDQRRSNGIYAKDSMCDIKNSSITSITFWQSSMQLTSSKISTILSLGHHSLARIKNGLELLGDNQSVIDLLLNDSAVIADEIRLSRRFDPNIRISNGAHLYINNLTNQSGGSDDFIFDVDESSYFNQLSPEFKISNEEENTDSEVENSKNDNSKEESKEKLNRLIGLGKVKQEIEKILRMVEFNQHRIKQGLKPQKTTLHAVFMGNPGTGKTTLARILGDLLFEHGVFSGDELKFIEVKEADLISNHVGQTAIQTKDILEQARGGILFIDEAYSLNKKDSSVNFGLEAINTILAFMEDHRDDTMIIFAGYTKEMEQFLSTNPGLKSRVSNVFLFEDYTDDEIIAMGEQQLLENEYTLEDIDYYRQNVARAYNASLDRSNGRWIRNFNEKLYKAVANRTIASGNFDDISTITRADIDEVIGKNSHYEAGSEDPFAALNQLIGLDKVKEQIENFVYITELKRRREEENAKNADISLHSLFLGNPGTGKTTVARILGDILYQKGVISTQKFVECSRSDLVAGYVGQTAIKTREVLESALGGVLFIDEAYTLNPRSGNDFGQEAINEILKFMEDHRRDIVIIFAGYTDEMADFLNSNSGLASRVPNVFDFEDYTDDEIVEIGLLGIQKQGYQINEDLYESIVKELYAESDDHSNGRWVRNLNERLISILSRRVANDPNADINQIVDEDLLKLRE